MNEHNVIYNYSPINIEGTINARMQQWLFGVVTNSCAHVATFGALEILLSRHKIVYPIYWYETLFNKPIFLVSSIVSHGDLPMQVSTIKWSTWGRLNLVLLGMKINGMQILKNINIIHVVIGSLFSWNVMCIYK